MLAELQYGTASYTDIAADITKVMTGTMDLSALSASLLQSKSSITGTAGSWTALTTTATAVTDICVASSPFATQEAKILLSRKCAYNANKTKYLRMVLGSASSPTTSFAMAANLGSGTSNGLITGASYAARLNSTILIPGISDNTNHRVSGLVVKIFVSPQVTAIMVGGTGLNLNTVFAVFDFQESNIAPDLTATDMLPACIVFPFLNLLHSFHVPVFTYNGNTYGSLSAEQFGRVIMSAGKFALPRETQGGSLYSNGTPVYQANTIGANFLLDNPAYKFSNFQKNGTSYDIFPLCLTGIQCDTAVTTQPVGSNKIVSGLDYLGNPAATVQVLSDVASVWVANRYAFGKNGDVFQTSRGNLCKFDNFMIKVQ